MNVLFLNPPLIDRFSRTVRSQNNKHFPAWLAYSAGVVEESGHNVKLIDAPSLPHFQGLFREKDLFIPNFTPDLIIIETNGNTIYNDFDVAKYLKSFYPNTFIVMVGAFVTALGETILRWSKYVNAIAIGEYEYTIRDLANNEPIGNIDGLVFKKVNGIVRNKARKLIENLDELPLVSLTYTKHFSISWHKYSEITIITSRGCPFKCTFCVNPQVMHGHKFRAMSPERVVKEFEHISENFPGMDINIEDDCFSIDKGRVKKISELLIEKNLLLRWRCNVRADLDFELLQTMREAGCYSISVGFESASQSILDNIQKDINVTDYSNFVMDAKRAGVRIEGCFMIGNNGEDESTVELTKELSEELGCRNTIYPIYLYPGTNAYKWAFSKGFTKNDILSEWLMEDGLRGVLHNPGLSSRNLVVLSKPYIHIIEVIKKELHRCR